MLVEKASKEQLAALVLEHCQEDQRFQGQAVLELSTSGEQELEAVEALIKASVRANKRQGCIDVRGCDNICADLDDALEKGRRRIDRGQYDQALDIVQFVLLTRVKLAGAADSSSGSLSWTIDAALETVGLAAGALAESGSNRAKCVQKLLKAAEKPEFDGWDHWRYDLLRQAAVLAEGWRRPAPTWSRIWMWTSSAWFWCGKIWRKKIAPVRNACAGKGWTRSRQSGGSGPANSSICSMKSIEAGDSVNSKSVRPVS